VGSPVSLIVSIDHPEMNGKNGAQAFTGSFFLELAGTAIGRVLPIRLGDAFVQLASDDGNNGLVRLLDPLRIYLYSLRSGTGIG